MAVFSASESAMAMANIPGHLPESIKVLLFGCGLIVLASFGRKKTFKK